MAIECPNCGEPSARHLIGRPEYPSIAPQMIGGVIAALVFELSRKRRFRCETCGEAFYSHTIGSRIWLALWIWFVVALAVILASALLRGVMH